MFINNIKNLKYCTCKKNGWMSGMWHAFIHAYLRGAMLALAASSEIS